MIPRLPPPVVWTIAGSDSGGGAGLQADLKTCANLGVHGCSVVTAITAQSTTGIDRIDSLTSEQVAAQMDCLMTDLPPAAIKIGMVGHPSIAYIIAERLERHKTFVVLDPVLQASSGPLLWQGGNIDTFRSTLLPCANLITPNLSETEALVGERLVDDRAVEQAGTDLIAMGTDSVLIKGGHRETGDLAQDYFTDGQSGYWLSAPRIKMAEAHGTGCVLSTAIAAAYALGHPVKDSIVFGRGVLIRALLNTKPLGRGNNPVGVGSKPKTPMDLPWINPVATKGRHRRKFPSLGSRSIGLYPIVDSAAWVKRLLPHQPPWLQLRIKSPNHHQCEKEIKQAIEWARPTKTRLIINDYWELALRHGAHGVHLGQNDLYPEALNALEKAGILLGISTHNLSEIARATGEQPSYIALGTLFHTTTKTMDFPPLGLSSFRWLRGLVHHPMIAIGGIHFSQAKEVYDAGADGIAVISEIRDSQDLGQTMREWEMIQPEETGNETGP